MGGALNCFSFGASGWLPCFWWSWNFEFYYHCDIVLLCLKLLRLVS